MSRENEPGGGELGTLERLQQPAGRRDFLKWSGAGVLGAVAMAACSDDTDVRSITEVVTEIETDTVTVNPPPVTFPAVTLNFANNFGILNYAYALEQLEAAFYTQVVANAAFTTAFSENERRVLADLRDHEIAHREFFARAIPVLGGTLIPNLTPNFDAVNFASRDSVLVTARAFEDLGVAAYNGAGPLFTNDTAGQTLLTVAGKIVSVEARHAAAIRDLLAPRTGAFAPQAFDDAFTPQQVLAIAAPFIRNAVTATNVPTIS
ncbi:ferritin-like domain-containing protein [Longimicrobium sp.]|uniref:ferritin-like domain-containing protein n=1 Tax=Longimicrobium sp. TaxID=2029185 RepID=UPI003B3AA384